MRTPTPLVQVLQKQQTRERGSEFDANLTSSSNATKKAFTWPLFRKFRDVIRRHDSWTKSSYGFVKPSSSALRCRVPPNRVWSSSASSASRSRHEPKASDHGLGT